MLYLVSPLLVMLSPEGEAESLPSLKCDLLHEAYLPCLPLLRMTIQSPCCGPHSPLAVADISHSQLLLSFVGLVALRIQSAQDLGVWTHRSLLLHTLMLPSSDSWLKQKTSQTSVPESFGSPEAHFFSQLIIHAIKYLGRVGIVYWACSSRGALVTLPGHHMLEWDYSAQ